MRIKQNKCLFKSKNMQFATTINNTPKHQATWSQNIYARTFSIPIYLKFFLFRSSQEALISLKLFLRNRTTLTKDNSLSVLPETFGRKYNLRQCVIFHPQSQPISTFLNPSHLNPNHLNLSLIIALKGGIRLYFCAVYYLKYFQSARDLRQSVAISAEK